MIGYIVLIIYLIVGWHIANIVDTEDMLLDALVMLLWPAIVIIVVLTLMLGDAE